MQWAVLGRNGEGLQSAAISDGALHVDRFKRFPTPLVWGSVEYYSLPRVVGD